MIFETAASSPLTVLAAGITTTIMITGSAAVPMSYLVLMVVLMLLAVGYLGVSRHVVQANPFFALTARGLSPRLGTAVAVIDFVAYNCIEISLFPLLGAQLAGRFGGPWWLWAAMACALIAGNGVLRGIVNAIVLGGFLLVELTVCVMFMIAAFTHPAPQAPSVLGALTGGPIIGPGLSIVLALGMAANIGFEIAPVYAEEARSHRFVRRATFAVIAFFGIFYCLCALAVAVGIGTNALTAGGDPVAMVFGVLRTSYGAAGKGLAQLAGLLLITSVLAAMSSFHHVIARNVFGLARERIIPEALGTLSTGSRGGTPYAGSLLQSGIAAVTIAAFAIAKADPMAIMFTWLSTIGALFILTLLVIASVAALGFYRKGGGTNEGVFARTVAPIVGIVTGGMVVLFMVWNLGGLLGLSPGSRLMWLPVGLLASCALAGVLWGSIIKWVRPRLYAGLGNSRPNAIGVLDPRLAELPV